MQTSSQMLMYIAEMFKKFPILLNKIALPENALFLSLLTFTTLHSIIPQVKRYFQPVYF